MNNMVKKMLSGDMGKGMKRGRSSSPQSYAQNELVVFST